MKRYSQNLQSTAWSTTFCGGIAVVVGGATVAVTSGVSEPIS